MIARLTRARGIKGEISSVPLSDNPERVTRVYIRDIPLEIERTWWHQDKLVFKFAGIDTMTDAEKLNGADVCIPLEERAPLPEGEYYHSDLIGAQVIDLTTQHVIGQVRGWQEYGGPPLIEVTAPDGREILIPFVKDICREIDPAAKRIGAVLPDGLLDL